MPPRQTNEMNNGFIFTKSTRRCSCKCYKIFFALILGQQKSFEISPPGREYSFLWCRQQYHWPCTSLVVVSGCDRVATSWWLGFESSQWQYFVEHNLCVNCWKHKTHGQWCDPVGRAVTSIIKDPRFESSHRQKIIFNVYCQLLWKDEKEAEKDERR